MASLIQPARKVVFLEYSLNIFNPAFKTTLEWNIGINELRTQDQWPRKSFVEKFKVSSSSETMEGQQSLLSHSQSWQVPHLLIKARVRDPGMLSRWYSQDLQGVVYAQQARNAKYVPQTFGDQQIFYDRHLKIFHYPYSDSKSGEVQLGIALEASVEIGRLQNRQDWSTPYRRPPNNNVSVTVER